MSKSKQELDIPAPEQQEFSPVVPVALNVDGIFSGPCFGDRTPSATSVATATRTPSPGPGPSLAQGSVSSPSLIHSARSLEAIVPPSPNFMPLQLQKTQDVKLQPSSTNPAPTRYVCAEMDLPRPPHPRVVDCVRNTNAPTKSVLVDIHEMSEPDSQPRNTTNGYTCQPQDHLDLPTQTEYADISTSSPPSSSPPHIFSSSPPTSSQASIPCISSPVKFPPHQTQRELVQRTSSLDMTLDTTETNSTLDPPATWNLANPTNIASKLQNYNSNSSATPSPTPSQILLLSDPSGFSSPDNTKFPYSSPSPRASYPTDDVGHFGGTPLGVGWSATSTSPPDSLMPLFATNNYALPSPPAISDNLALCGQHLPRSTSPLLDIYSLIMSSPIINPAATIDVQNNGQDLDPRQPVLTAPFLPTSLGTNELCRQRLIEGGLESPLVTPTRVVSGGSPIVPRSPVPAPSSTISSNTSDTSITLQPADDIIHHQHAVDHSPQPKIISSDIDTTQSDDQADTKNKIQWAMGADRPTPSPMSMSPTRHAVTGKRKREDEMIHHGSHGTVTDSIDSSPRRSEIPNPKRPTQAAQRLQRQKLTTPFRSPVVKKVTPMSPAETAIKPPPLPQLIPIEAKSGDDIPRKGDGVEEASRKSGFDANKRHRTTRASAQFKSPLSAKASTSMPLVRLTPTIQTLERKIQVLKRALKVKEGNDEAVLEGLVRKWKEAGREVAWEVWELVKDNTDGDDGVWGKTKSKTTSFGNSWGWDSQEEGRGASKERNWGWDTTPNTSANGGRGHMSEETKVESDDEERVQDTLGTMLRQLGIDPDTLGWNEDEGTFVDS